MRSHHRHHPPSIANLTTALIDALAELLYFVSTLPHRYRW